MTKQHRLILAPNNVFCRGMECGICHGSFSSKDSVSIEPSDTNVSLQFTTVDDDLVCDECAEKHAPEQMRVVREIARLRAPDPDWSQISNCLNDKPRVTTDEYFGGCPECGKSDGYLNAGRTHVFFCREHKVRWIAGSNLFSDWRNETEEEQRRAWNEAGLEGTKLVEPIYPERNKGVSGSRVPIRSRQRDPVLKD